MLIIHIARSCNKTQYKILFVSIDITRLNECRQSQAVTVLTLVQMEARVHRVLYIYNNAKVEIDKCPYQVSSVLCITLMWTNHTELQYKSLAGFSMCI